MLPADGWMPDPMVGSPAVGSTVAAGRSAASRSPAPGVWARAGRCRRRVVAEQVLETPATGLKANQGQAEIGNRVSDFVISALGIDLDEKRPPIPGDGEPSTGQRCCQRRLAVLDLDRDHPGPARERPQRCRLEEAAALDRDEEVAHPLDLPAQGARDA